MTDVRQAMPAFFIRPLAGVLTTHHFQTKSMKGAADG